MNRNAVIIIVVLVIVVVIAFLVSSVRSRTPKYKWEPQYSRKSEQPYGLKYFHELLKEQGHKVDVISNDEFYFLDSTYQNTNLILIDSYADLDSFTVASFLDFVKNGNKLFVALDETPWELLSNFVPSIDSSGYQKFYSQVINVGFIEKKLTSNDNDRLVFHYQYLKKVTGTDWSGYLIDHFRFWIAGEQIKPVSFFNDSIINCFYVPCGKGKVVFHTNPILFSNYNIIQKDGYKNANNVLSHLNSGPVLWYEYSYPELNGDSGGYENNPLKFLFSHYTLKTAWFTLIAGVLIFLLFRSKREQRIIPILYKHKNTSIEYAKAVGSLYYKRKSHHGIATELYTIFLSDIRSRYQIITYGDQKELIEQLSRRSEVSIEILTDLFKHFDARHDVNTSSRQLVKLHKALENFNKIKK